MTAKQYHFRDFRLDPAARELWRGDRQVALPASALDGLIYLIEQRARAVGRDELIAAIWGRSDVADALLAQTILRIRRELGDASAEQSAIRTVPRFGYRWIAETQVVEGVPSAPAATPVETPPAGRGPVEAPPAESAPEPPPRRRRVPGWAAAALLVLLASVALLGARLAVRGGAAPDAPSAAAVLPAAAPDLAEWSWLRLGLMDLVASRLRQGGVAAMPSESVLALLRQDGSATPPAALRIRPRAELRDGEWSVALDAEQAGAALSVQARAGDVLAAARAAADELLIRLGRTPPPAPSAGPASLALQELLQRTRAAILADRFDLARSLIAQAPADLQGRPEVALRLAQIEVGEGDYAGAQRRLTLLLDRLPHDVDPVLHGKILNVLGGVQVRRGALAEADASYAEAIERLRPAQDEIGLGQAYSGRAAIAARRGDADAATADLGRARTALEAGGDAFGVAQVDMNLGVVAAQRYRPAEALPILDGAAARLATIGAREELAYARYAKIGAELQLLDVDAARATSDRTWPADAHTGNRRLRLELGLARAWVLLGQGRLSEAGALLGQIERGAAAELDAGVQAGARALAARIALARGDAAEAARLAAAALTPELESDDADAYLGTWVVRLRALRESGRLAEAAAGTAALRAWADAHANDWRRLHADLAEAEQAWAGGERERALALFAAAAERADRLGVPEDRVEAGVAYLRALLALGRTDRASAFAAALAPWSERDYRVAAAEAELYRALGRSDAWQRAAERAARLAGERALPAPTRAVAALD